MDDLGGHKGDGVRKAIEAAGAAPLYVPPCSSDLHPIGKAFSNLKAPPGKAAERTIDGLRSKIGELLSVFTPGECVNFFAAAGYQAL